MINEVKKEDITFADAHTKFEAGTMQTAEVVAFANQLILLKIWVLEILLHMKMKFYNMV